MSTIKDFLGSFFVIIRVVKNAILLHGLADKKEYYSPEFPSASNSHWFPWLQKELLIHEFKADTPEVFREYELHYESWVEEIERFPIGSRTVLVGHSAGGGFWVRYLSEHPEIFVDKVILVAPWLNLEHEIDTTFYDFDINPHIVKHANKFIIFSSDNDKQEVIKSVEYLIDRLPNVEVISFPGYGHFTHRTLKDNRFPELLQVIIS